MQGTIKQFERKCECIDIYLPLSLSLETAESRGSQLAWRDCKITQVCYVYLYVYIGIHMYISVFTLQLNNVP